MRNNEVAKEKTIVRRIDKSMYKGKREKRQRNDSGRSESHFPLLRLSSIAFFSLKTMHDFCGIWKLMAFNTTTKLRLSIENFLLQQESWFNCTVEKHFLKVMTFYRKIVLCSILYIILHLEEMPMQNFLPIEKIVSKINVHPFVNIIYAFLLRYVSRWV